MEGKYRKYIETLLENKDSERAREIQSNKGNRKTEIKPDYEKELKEILQSKDTPLSADLLSLIENTDIKEEDLENFESKKALLKKIKIDYNEAKDTYKKCGLGSNEIVDNLLSSDKVNEEYFVNTMVKYLQEVKNDNKKSSKNFDMLYRAYVYSNGSFKVDNMNWSQDRDEVLSNNENNNENVPGVSMLKDFLELPDVNNILKELSYDSDKKKMFIIDMTKKEPKEVYDLSKLIKIDNLIDGKIDLSNNRKDFYNLFIEILLDLMNVSSNCTKSYSIASSDNKKEEGFINNIKKYIVTSYVNDPISNANPFTGQNRLKGLISALKKKSESNASNNNPKVNFGSAESKQISNNELKDTSGFGRTDSKNIDVVLSVPYVDNNIWKRNNFLIQLKTTWSTQSKEPVSEIVKFLKSEIVNIKLKNNVKTQATTMAVVDGEQWRKHLLGKLEYRFISKETNNNSYNALKEAERMKNVKGQTKINFVGTTNIRYCYTSLKEIPRGLFTEEFVKYLNKITENLVLTVNSKKEDFEKNFDSVYTESQTAMVIQHESESFKSIVNDMYESVLKIERFMQENNMAGLNTIKTSLNNLKKIKNMDVGRPNPMNMFKQEGISFNYNQPARPIKTFEDIRDMDRKNLKQKANNIRNRK